jgi:hypothetical protein
MHYKRGTKINKMYSTFDSNNNNLITRVSHHFHYAFVQKKIEVN